MKVRLIPPQTRQSVLWIGKLNFKDICFCVVLLAIMFLAITATPLPFIFRLIIVTVLIVVMFVGVHKMGYVKGYEFISNWIQYLFRQKKIAAQKLAELATVEFNEYVTVTSKNPAKGSAPTSHYSAVIELKGIDFEILAAHKQDRKVMLFADAISHIENGSLVKLERPLDLSTYIEQNKEKMHRLTADMQADTEANVLKYSARIDLIENSNVMLEYRQTQDRVICEAFFVVIYDSDKNRLEKNVDAVLKDFTQIGLAPKRLQGSQIEEFYRLWFDCPEGEELGIPKVEEKFNKIVLGGKEKKVLTVGEYPFFVADSWGWELFSIPNTKVTLNFNVAEKKNVYKHINRSIAELQSQYADRKAGEVEKKDCEDKVAALTNLIDQLRHDREQLHNVGLYIICDADKENVVEERFKNSGLFLDPLFFKQMESYIQMLPYLPMADKPPKTVKEMQTTSLASTFPFISRLFLDKRGDYMGTGKYPIFFDLWTGHRKLDKMRSNNSMTIFGKSGNGKSFFMKKLLLQQACDGTKIFILDPENEYDWLCKKLHGNWIDVGGTRYGTINPMQVFPSLEPDDDEEEFKSGSSGELFLHLQFLEKFFRLTMPDLDNECRPYLNRAIREAYAKKKISDNTDFKKLRSEDYPLMQDIYDYIESQVNKQNKLDEYDRLCYKKLINHLADFANGGVHSRLWNQYTTLKLDNDFTVLNFQSLFGNNNDLVANGQMLLIMRYLNQEVIKNREQNMYGNQDKNIIIAIDEAHCFVNSELPVALQFMAQQAKRIRKYGGGQIVATQNVNDFVGTSEAMKAQATAVINNSQYSLLFGLNPDDVTQVADLYKSYNGGLTRAELDILTDAPVGKALFVIDANTRFSADIKIFAGEEAIIDKQRAA